MGTPEDLGFLTIRKQGTPCRSPAEPVRPAEGSVPGTVQDVQGLEWRDFSSGGARCRVLHGSVLKVSSGCVGT